MVGEMVTSSDHLRGAASPRAGRAAPRPPSSPPRSPPGGSRATRRRTPAPPTARPSCPSRGRRECRAGPSSRSSARAHGSVAEVYEIWCAPSSPARNDTTSPSSSSRVPSGVRSVGRPARTMNISSLAWGAGQGEGVVPGGSSTMPAPSADDRGPDRAAPSGGRSRGSPRRRRSLGRKCLGRARPGARAVDQPAVGRARGFEHGLGERRVRVDRAGELGVAALELARDDQLLDQLGRLAEHDVRRRGSRRTSCRRRS